MSSPPVPHAGTNTTAGTDPTVIKKYEKTIAALTLILSIMLNNVINYDCCMVIYLFAEEFEIRELLSQLPELKAESPGSENFIGRLLTFIMKVTKEPLPNEAPPKISDSIARDEERKTNANSKGTKTCIHGYKCTNMPCDHYHPCRELIVIMFKDFITAYKEAKIRYINAPKTSKGVNGDFTRGHVATGFVTPRFGFNNTRSQSTDRYGSHSQTPRGQGNSQYQGKIQDRSISRGRKSYREN
jgi:hypothetical protein